MYKNTIISFCHQMDAVSICRKSALTILFTCTCIIVFGQNGVSKPERKYKHVGGFEHVVKSITRCKKTKKQKIS